MKKKLFITSGIMIGLAILFFIDRKVGMKYRVMHHDRWEHDKGELYNRDNDITRGMISVKYIVHFKKNTMVMDYGEKWGRDTLVLKWQYFDSMKVMDPKTGKTSIYRKFPHRM